MKPAKQRVFTSRFVGVVLFLVALAFAHLAGQERYVGFHNIDLVYNYQNIALELNPHLALADLKLVGTDQARDVLNDGQNLTLTEVYYLGHHQQNMAMLYMLASLSLAVLGTWRINDGT